ncbi:hypothetical protein COTS27_00678 [Spirochaetota bacterium]|nr:hypothetical protein COTS27_00678 [Spirochaetota bacterium]
MKQHYHHKWFTQKPQSSYPARPHTEHKNNHSMMNTIFGLTQKAVVFACTVIVISSSGWIQAQTPTPDATPTPPADAQQVEQPSDNTTPNTQYQRRNFALEAYQKRIEAQYIYGFNGIEFFMTLEQVKEKLNELGLTANVTVQENDSDIYAFPKALRHDFIFYNNTINRYYDFSILAEDMEAFLPKIVEKRLPTRIYHLTKIYKNDFKLLTVPASIENNQPWIIKFVFFNRELNNQNVFRLFAISLTYHDENRVVGNLSEVPSVLLKRVRKKVYDKYGSPQHKRSVFMGDNLEVEKFYETFTRYYAVENYRYNVPFPGNYSIAVQLGISYANVGLKSGNFQISYVATDYLRELFSDFTTSQQRYDDFDLKGSTNINF